MEPVWDREGGQWVVAAKAAHSAAGLCLKVISSVEGKSNLVVVLMPICEVSMPVKGVGVDGAIALNQMLFHKAAAIQLGIAKPGAGNSQKLGVRKGAK